MIHIKDKFPSWKEIDKMIEEEFRNNSIVDVVSVVEIPNPSIRGKYSTRLGIDEKLDDRESIKTKIRQYVDEEIFKALIDINEKYLGTLERKVGQNGSTKH